MSSPLILGVLGAGLVWCWWQIRALGDVRLQLGVFYGWYAAAFALYLVSLWLINTRGDVSLRRQKGNVPIFGVLLVAALARLMMLGTTPTLSEDIYRYRWDGKVQLAGINPYAYAPNDPSLAVLRDAQDTKINFPHLRTIYPPLTQLAFRLGAWLGPTLTAQKIVFVGAELLIIGALLVILRQRRRSPLWVLAYAWHPLVILEVAGQGHNDALGVALLWVGIAACDRAGHPAKGGVGEGSPDAEGGGRKWWWLGVTLGWSAAFLSKFASAILLPWWWCRRVARGWLMATVVFIAIPLVLCFSCVRALIESLSAMTTRFESNASLYLVLTWLTGSAAIARVLAVGLGTAFLLWWAHRQSDPIRYVLGALSVAALLSPVLHPWYLVWLIPCLCFYRPAAVVALTATAVLAYTVWPGRLADGRWMIPLWAHVLEYVPVFVLGLWEIRRWWSRSSFQLATKPLLSAKS